MILNRSTAVVFAVVLAGGCEAADPTLAPAGLDLPYVVDPACPGEGCLYGQWLSCDSVRLLEGPDPDASTLSWLERDQWFEVEGGRVIVRQPATYVARRAVPDDSVGWESWIPMSAGDTLYVLDYLGEGFHNVSWQGSIQNSFQFWVGQRPDTVHSALALLQPGINEFWGSTRLPSGELGWLQVVPQSVFTASRYSMMPEACPARR